MLSLSRKEITGLCIVVPICFNMEVPCDFSHFTVLCYFNYVVAFCGLLYLIISYYDLELGINDIE